MIIRCINAITKPSNFSDKVIADYSSLFQEFMFSENVVIGQKLFIMNVYLENLDKFGKKNDCTQLFEKLEEFTFA